MESFGGCGFSGVNAVKKRRSVASRRPRPDSQFLVEAGRDLSSPSSNPSSDNGSKLSPHDNLGNDAAFRRKELSLNSSTQRVASINRIEGLCSSKKSRRDDRRFADVDAAYRSGGPRGGLSGIKEQGRSGSDLRRCSEGVLAPANWKSCSKARENFDMQSRSPDGYAGRHGDHYSSGQSVGGCNASGENKLRKVKLKVGGVTRMIHAKSNPETGNSVDSSAKSSRSSDPSRHRQKLILQDNSDDDDQSPPEKGNGVQEVAWRDSGGASRGEKEDSRGKVTEESLSLKQMDKSHGINFSEPTRKSKRVPKKRVLDSGYDDTDEDGETRYLERLKTSKVVKDYGAEYEDSGEDSLKKRKISKISKSKRTLYDVDEDYVSRTSRDGRRRSRTGKESDDMDYMEEEDPGSDVGPEPSKKKKQKESGDAPTDIKAEPLTTRQRALQSSKDGGTGTNLIEFPNGLPPAPSRKLKEKLSEVDLQAKKAEAAQRRRMQVEKANKEQEAAAISKILGHDPKKKKKEEEKLRELNEKAQKKAAKALNLAPSTVRWIIGPAGTVVTFAEDVGFPSLFDSKPCSYPPPREKCAGPSCMNAYKYRDSKSNLPLCSLQCYKAIQERSQSLTTC